MSPSCLYGKDPGYFGNSGLPTEEPDQDRANKIVNFSRRPDFINSNLHPSTDIMAEIEEALRTPRHFGISRGENVDNTLDDNNEKESACKVISNQYNPSNDDNSSESVAPEILQIEENWQITQEPLNDSSPESQNTDSHMVESHIAARIETQGDDFSSKIVNESHVEVSNDTNPPSVRRITPRYDFSTPGYKIQTPVHSHRLVIRKVGRTPVYHPTSSSPVETEQLRAEPTQKEVSRKLDCHQNISIPKSQGDPTDVSSRDVTESKSKDEENELLSWKDTTQDEQLSPEEIARNIQAGPVSPEPMSAKAQISLSSVSDGKMSIMSETGEEGGASSEELSLPPLEDYQRAVTEKKDIPLVVNDTAGRSKRQENLTRKTHLQSNTDTGILDPTEQDYSPMSLSTNVGNAAHSDNDRTGGRNLFSSILEGMKLNEPTSISSDLLADNSTSHIQLHSLDTSYNSRNQKDQGSISPALNLQLDCIPAMDSDNDRAVNGPAVSTFDGYNSESTKDGSEGFVYESNEKYIAEESVHFGNNDDSRESVDFSRKRKATSPDLDEDVNKPKRVEKDFVSTCLN